MASLIPSQLVESLTNVSKSLVEPIRNAPSTTILSSVAAVATAYLVLTRFFEINKPAGYRKIPSVTSITIRGMFSKLSVSERFELTREAFEKHGIVRANLVQFERVDVATPEYVKLLLTQPDDFPKLEIAVRNKNSLFALFLGVNLVFSNGDVWKRHRRAANPAFHRAWDTRIFGDVTLRLFDQMDILIDKGSSLDIHDYAQRLTLDMLGKAVFNYDFASIENPNGDYVQTYNNVLRGSNNPAYFLFPWLDSLPFTRRYKAFRNVNHFNDLIDGLIDTRRKELAVSGLPDGNAADLLSLMIMAGKDQESKGLTDMELRNNMTVFFLAGHDTTANSLACIVYFLAVHQDIQRKAREEVIALLSADSTALITPTFEESKQLPYLTNVIKESLRLCPSASSVSGRMTTRDVAFGEYIIPKGTVVTVNIWAMHHSRKIWGDDVEEFKPERFEGHIVDEKLADPDAASSEGKRDNYAWIPFSAGPRACIGMNFSYLEQRVVLSMLLQKYEWVLPADSLHKDKLHFRSGNLLRPDDLQIQFKKRF